ncbi:hypothetical protein EDEG_03284 [Edhazardia aedis USNM 41457]|uniref:Uncharacterized protein n=1 Tax=Edhazardia aedis (strain USNM 41457) TaxID=1003232 RepID=J8ZRF6_EDHAE|nr:hypothetical protein EDEG_03284 [Edhazardia aedis USNM 41457]|eukprot:EJW02278.1 hypothetical protein EDEG_03284 [Edhazardia aedis USNM 41457]
MKNFLNFSFILYKKLQSFFSMWPHNQKTVAKNFLIKRFYVLLIYYITGQDEDNDENNKLKFIDADWKFNKDFTHEKNTVPFISYIFDDFCCLFKTYLTNERANIQKCSLKSHIDSFFRNFMSFFSSYCDMLKNTELLKNYNLQLKYDINEVESLCAYILAIFSKMYENFDYYKKNCQNNSLLMIFHHRKRLTILYLRAKFTK